MDKLKKFIDTNRDAFDDEKLSEGHLERFEAKLPLPERGRKIRLYSLFAVIAAASVMLLFFLKFPGDTIPHKEQQPVAYEPIPLQGISDTLKDNKEKADKEQKQQSPIKKGEDRDEIKELRLYYNMQMNEVLSQMQQAVYKKEQTPGASDLLRESKRILTDNFMFEETVLPTLPSSNIGLYAMTQHYNTSLESLSIILRQMEGLTNK